MSPDPDRLATKDDLAVLDSDLRTEMADLRLAVSEGINEAFQAQTRVLLVGLVVSVALIALSNTLAVVAG